MHGAALVRRAAGREGNQPKERSYTRRKVNDRDEAEQIITDLYLPNRLDLTEDSAPLGMEVTGLGLEHSPLAG